MVKPHCNHDPRYLEKRLRKRSHVDGNAPSTSSVPPKVQPLQNGNNFSSSRDTQANNYQMTAGFNLNISAGDGKTGSSKSVNILAIAAGLAEPDESLSDAGTSSVVQQHSNTINGSAIRSSEIFASKNSSLLKTSTYQTEKEGINTVDDEDVECLPGTAVKEERKPNVAANTVTPSKTIDVITLDSDTEDESDAIIVKPAEKIASSSSEESSTRDDSEIEEIVKAMPNAKITNEVCYTEDTFVENFVEVSSVNATTSVQEITVASTSGITADGFNTSTNGGEKHMGDVSTRIATDAAIDRLISSLTGISTCMESTLTSEDDDCSVIEHSGNIAVNSSSSAEISNDQNIPSKVTSQVDLTIASTTINIQNSSPEVTSESLSNDVFDGAVATSSVESLSTFADDDYSVIEHPGETATTSSASVTTSSDQNILPKLDLTTALTSGTVNTQNGSLNLKSPICSNVVTDTSLVKNGPSIEQNTDNERTLTHHNKSQKEVPEIELKEHKDSLSYFVAKQQDENIRGPEVIDNLLQTDIDASKIFTVLSYNVLSQAKIEKNKNLYPKIYEFPEMFNWDYRWRLLSIELDRFHADICCLQEVERDRVEKFYHPKMVGTKGYESFYAWRKEGESDGCAIYWNSEKFDKIQEVTIPLYSGVPNLNRANVAQILLLKHKKTEKEIIVANTQLISDQKSDVKKLFQLASIFAHLHKIRTNNQSVIFCGDFNLKPYSLLFKFITDGEIDCEKDKCTSIDGNGRSNKSIEEFSIPAVLQISNNCTFVGENDEGGEASDICTTTMRHLFNLESVYGKLTYNANNLLSTFHHKRDEDNAIINYGNPDYIFYSIKERTNVKKAKHEVTEKDLFLHQRLSLPDKESLEDLIKFTPHDITGSDHLPLFAEFFFA